MVDLYQLIMSFWCIESLWLHYCLSGSNSWGSQHKSPCSWTTGKAGGTNGPTPWNPRHIPEEMNAGVARGGVKGPLPQCLSPLWSTCLLKTLLLVPSCAPSQQGSHQCLLMHLHPLCSPSLTTHSLPPLCVSTSCKSDLTQELTSGGVHRYYMPTRHVDTSYSICEFYASALISLIYFVCVCRQFLILNKRWSLWWVFEMLVLFIFQWYKELTVCLKVLKTMEEK